MTRTAFLFLFIITLMAGQLSGAPAQAKSDLDEILRQTMDDLLRGRIERKRQENSQAGQGVGANKTVPQSRQQMALSFAPLVREVAPSVVNVYAARRVRQRSPFANDPFFERFFGRQFGGGRAPSRVQSSLGSGVIVSSEGVIVTNHHVIKDADEVKIALNDGSEYECDIVLKDEKTDLAILRTKEKAKFSALKLADSDAVEVGDLVLAIGNPFGVGQTVTSGIVSAVARSSVGIGDFDFFIQTDAAINPGNSGGALIDMHGRLIGINTAIYTRSGGSIGLGFAIPANMAAVVLRSAQSGEKYVERPWIGAEFQNITSEIAESLGLRRPAGVLIASVSKGGPAHRAGLRSGDVLIGINGNIVNNTDALGYRLDTVGIGNVAEFTIISNGRRHQLAMRLRKAPETTARDQTELAAGSALGGAVIANLSPSVAQQLGVSSQASGAVVLGLRRNSEAMRNGVRKGDIIVAINNTKTRSVKDVVRVVEQNSGTKSWQVVLQRGPRVVSFERRGGFFRQYIR